MTDNHIPDDLIKETLHSLENRRAQLPSGCGVPVDSEAASHWAHGYQEAMTFADDVLHVASAMAAELLAAREKLKAMEWQPIETAPKDCQKFILLFCPEDQSTWLASWQAGEWYGVDELGLTRSGHGLGSDVTTVWFVTHWMHLPIPPAPEAAQETKT